MRLMRRYDVVTHADTTSMQMFLWERFKVLAPKVIKLPTMDMGEVVSTDGLGRTKRALMFTEQRCCGGQV